MDVGILRSLSVQKFDYERVTLPGQNLRCDADFAHHNREAWGARLHALPRRADTSLTKQRKEFLKESFSVLLDVVFDGLHIVLSAFYYKKPSFSEKLGFLVSKT
jgi:hypothetical protein